MKDCYTCDESNCAFSGQNFSSKYAALCKGIKPTKALIDATLGKQIIHNVIRPCLTSAKQCEVKYFNLTEIKEEK